MKINQNMSVHNRFDIIVRDAVTGKEKQKAVAYNVVCDGYFTLLFSTTVFSSGPSFNRTLFNKIAFGSGTGNPANTDTNLFTRIDALTTSNYETVYGTPTSYRTVQIVLDADHYNGSTITEVGLIGQRNVSPVRDTLLSHAMIQDSEGEPIAITKTNTDVVTIRATFYVTFSQNGFGNNGVYPAASSNELVKFALGLIWNDSQQATIAGYTQPLQHSSDMNSMYTYKASSYFEPIINTSARTLTISKSILTDEGGRQVYRCVGFPGIGAFNFPDASAMSYYRVTGRAIGTGDGVTVDYALGVPCVKPGTTHIYVNDVEQTEGTDYTLDCNANDSDTHGEYYSASLSFIDMPERVKWGDARTRVAESGSIYDPLLMIYSKYANNSFARYCYITQNDPIWLDFLTAKECNTLKIYGTLPAGKQDSLAIEYSNDNESWSAVIYTRTDQIYKWGSVSARYWRIYIPNYSWKYDLRECIHAARDGGMGSYAYWFLGKTKPALHFNTPPAQDAVITATFDLDVPFKTENNLIRITIVVTFNRD